MTGFFMLVYKLKAKLELVYALGFNLHYFILKMKAKNNLEALFFWSA